MRPTDHDLLMVTYGMVLIALVVWGLSLWL